MLNKKAIIAVASVLGLILIFLIYKFIFVSSNDSSFREIKPEIGVIENVITTTGLVLPKNRLEIKPPVNGRIEKILVKEGEKTTVGRTLAWMSSTERAALLDAAREQGDAALKYWNEAYRPIALMSPIDGEVIVAKTQPGQTVTVNDPVIVLSDELIIRSQVDETDIAKVFLGQFAFVTLDAYPETKISAKVDHIYHESRTVNNVTVYEVDLIPKDPPDFIRSGMNASVNYITEKKEGALLVPSDAVFTIKGEKYLLIKSNGRPVERRVEVGISSDKKLEILSGIDQDDVVLISPKKFSVPKNNQANNPFMPIRPKNK